MSFFTTHLPREPEEKFSPEYEALSYVWGSQEFSHCNSPSSRPEENRVIWIDALCINQSDIEERDAQVGRMGDICRLAKRVVVWLGPEENNSNIALETLDHLGEQVVVSSDLVTAACPESAETELADLKKPLPWNEKACNNVWPDFITPSDIRDISLQALCTRSRSPIIEKFQGMINKRCCDPRDYIYGALGMAMPAFRARIKPHYGHTVERVHQEAPITHIEHFKRLEVLSMCFQKDRRFDRLPSWVPDFSAQLDISGPQEQFAAGFSRALVQFSESEPNIIQVAGDNYYAALEALRAIAPENLGLDTTTPYPTGEPFKTAYAITLCQDSLEDRFEGGKYPRLKTWIKQDSPNALFGPRAKENKDKSVIPTGYEDTIVTRCQGRPYVVTEEGYIGWGATGTQPGDIICVFLGSKDPIILRPQPESDSFTLVGNRDFYGLGDANVLLGPLPFNWSVVVDDDTSGYCFFQFWNKKTKLTKDDPRLGALPEGWESVKEHRERTGDDPFVYRWFRNVETGEEINWDPRMSIDALKKRGVNIEMFSLE
ncbi:heterokaryon incompatibility protein-domain-containing protein [Podospora fimiseda]|uniref:Heterokaryon incompatibility protein-domain-containing protein n=1 Tax=Podospora fimiseda TaxID=252190 RepID=A0AAN7BI48_9PEZI|nr:heterokaryon incompatibility protein-domain-containing protein [Podospora fimiseda]